VGFSQRNKTTSGPKLLSSFLLTAHRSNRPDYWDGLMLDRSAVGGQLSSLSSRTKWQRLQAGNTLHSVSPAEAVMFFTMSALVSRALDSSSGRAGGRVH